MSLRCGLHPLTSLTLQGFWIHMAAVKKKKKEHKYTLQDASSGASIFVGGLEAAERACKSNELGFTHIVDCRGDPTKGRFNAKHKLDLENTVQHHNIQVNRLGRFNNSHYLLKFDDEFDKEFDFLVQAIRDGGRILIFCVNGANESPRVALTVDLAVNFCDETTKHDDSFREKAEDAAKKLKARRSLIKYHALDEEHCDGVFQAWYYAIFLWRRLDEVNVGKSSVDRVFLPLDEFNKFINLNSKDDLGSLMLRLSRTGSGDRQADSSKIPQAPSSHSKEPSSASGHAAPPQESIKNAQMVPSAPDTVSRDRDHAVSMKDLRENAPKDCVRV